MKRNFASVYTENRKAGYARGDQHAHVAAAALAQCADAPTINAIRDALMLMETVGGQFYITPLRVQDDYDAGKYNVEAIVFNYETRDLKVQKYEAPEEIMGIPVTQSHEPGVEVEQPTEISLEDAEPPEEPVEETETAEPTEYPVEV